MRLQSLDLRRRLRAGGSGPGSVQGVLESAFELAGFQAAQKRPPDGPHRRRELPGRWRRLKRLQVARSIAESCPPEGTRNACSRRC